MIILKKIGIMILILFVIFLTGCDNKNSKEELESKVTAEIEFINTKSIDILNDLNNISFRNYTVASEKVSLEEGGNSSQQGGGAQSNSSGGQSGTETQNQGGGSGQNQQSAGNQQGTQTNQEVTTTNMQRESVLNTSRTDIDWDSIKANIELINDSWNVILLDLYSLNVSNDIITEFTNIINNSIVSIKKQDKKLTLTNLASLYAILPEFLNEINSDENERIKKQTQSYIINAYSLVDTDLIDVGIATNIENAKKEFEQIMTDEEYMKNKSYKINKAYVLLSDLQNSITSNDIDVFYIKYKSLMETINTL